MDKHKTYGLIYGLIIWINIWIMEARAEHVIMLIRETCNQ
jgi:hypothetical protein